MPGTRKAGFKRHLKLENPAHKGSVSSAKMHAQARWRKRREEGRSLTDLMFYEKLQDPLQTKRPNHRALAVCKAKLQEREVARRRKKKRKGANQGQNGKTKRDGKEKSCSKEDASQSPLFRNHVPLILFHVGFEKLWFYFEFRVLPASSMIIWNHF